MVQGTPVFSAHSIIRKFGQFIPLGFGQITCNSEREDKPAKKRAGVAGDPWHGACLGLHYPLPFSRGFGLRTIPS
ncbi:MAG TPA: hypothetical protein VE177_05375 [Candidatus Binatus sp.]|nr:hypothetical protein [Candidatus Binatus sp.]